MSDDARDAARYRHLRRNVSAQIDVLFVTKAGPYDDARYEFSDEHFDEAVDADMERAASAARSRLEEAESLLRKLTDIEGPQPGHVMWARKVWAFLGVPEPSATSENPDAVYDPVASDGHAGARARQIDDVADDSAAHAQGEHDGGA